MIALFSGAFAALVRLFAPSTDIDAIISNFTVTAGRLDALAQGLHQDNQETLQRITAEQQRIEGNCARIARASSISTKIKGIVG